MEKKLTVTLQHLSYSFMIAVTIISSVASSLSQMETDITKHVLYVKTGLSALNINRSSFLEKEMTVLLHVKEDYRRGRKQASVDVCLDTGEVSAFIDRLELSR